jgi:hypothetical protein
MQNSQKHNLQIEHYSFDELLDLFDIRSYDFSIEDLKRAKKKVLMLHPDKSRLGPEYFLFYKKALEIVVQFYDNQNKQNRAVNEQNTAYRATIDTNQNKSVEKQIHKTISAMDAKDFQSKFNTLFEKNQMAERPDPTKNAWFTSEDPAIQGVDTLGRNVNPKNMSAVFDSMKQQSSGLVRYRGVQEMVLNGGAGRLYDDDDDTENGDIYVSSDPFSKLKFDDLRKVHKDQTVFAVSESDYGKTPKYASVDEFQRTRNATAELNPLEKAEAQRILDQNQRLLKEQIMKREYAAKIKTQEYEKKNQSVLATFLRLGN